MKLLSRFIASVLSLVIVISASAYIVARTVWNPSRVQKAAHTTDAAGKIARVVPVILKSSFSLTPDEQFIVKTVVTEQNVSPLLDQVLKAIATSDGAPVKLDLGEFRKQIVAEGLPLTKDLENLTAQPITLISTDASARLASVKHTDGQIKIFGPLIAIVLIVLIFVVAKRQRFLVLAEAGTFAAIELALLGLLAPNVPGFATSAIASSDLAPLKDAYVSLAGNLALSIKQDFFLAAEIAAGISIVLFLIHGLVIFKAKFGKSRHHA